MNVNVTSTEWSLKQIVNSFSEDENYICIAKFANSVLIIPVTNAWPEQRQYSETGKNKNEECHEK